VGFPALFYDEGVYMRRAMHIEAGLGPQESNFHDHPFFGQYFLAGVFSIIGYPSSLNPTTNLQSMEFLYLVPRIIMGFLAVADTFLIYKITESQYKSSSSNNKVIAIIASTLFAVMPVTWFFRRILLDSILTPFMLSSILLAVYSKNNSCSQNLNGRYFSVIITGSGVLMGLAIFTKIPTFAMIPLVGFLIFINNNKSFKVLGLWFIPVILIPAIWPIQAISEGQFDKWVSDVSSQAHREQQQSSSNIIDSGFIFSIVDFYLFDPVLLFLGAAGIIYAAIRKDIFLMLWILPFVIFLSLIGYVQYFYWIPILPAFCIASGKLIYEISQMIAKTIKKYRQAMPYMITAAIGIFGVISTTMLISTNLTSNQFEAAAFVAQLTASDGNRGSNFDGRNTTIVSSPVYSWIFKYVFHRENISSDYRDLLYNPIRTDNILLIADPHFMWNINAGRQLEIAYNSTKTIRSFVKSSSSDKVVVGSYDENHYPYTSLSVNAERNRIDIRAGPTDMRLRETGMK
jgi:hypothetical protein